MLRLFGTLVATLIPTLAFAHPGHGNSLGLTHGFLHPISGLDHVLAMVAVGILAAQLGGRALWAVPLAFVGMMAVGGVLGMAGIALPFVEAGIALSIVGLGTAIAFNLRLPLVATATAVGIFAIFHGHAHGAEMPESASGLAYGLGFVAATAMLHGLGIGLGLALGRPSFGALTRVAGGATAVAGLALLGGAF
jgi:urease accessory protein